MPDRAAERHERGVLTLCPTLPFHRRQNSAWQQGPKFQPRAPATALASAGEAGMSGSSLFDGYLPCVCIRPMECLVAWRMVVATTLLNEGNLALREAASRIGHRSASTIKPAFHRHVGVPPAAHARCRPCQQSGRRAGMTLPRGQRTDLRSFQGICRDSDGWRLCRSRILVAIAELKLINVHNRWIMQTTTIRHVATK